VKKKSVFCLRILKAVYDWTNHFLWDCDEAAYHSSQYMVKKAAQFTATRMQRERRTIVSQSPSRAHPNDLKPPSRPHFLKLSTIFQVANDGPRLHM
jgi:hypothetical protein